MLQLENAPDSEREERSCEPMAEVGVPQALPPGARVIRASQPAPMPGAPQVMPASATRQGRV